MKCSVVALLLLGAIALIGCSGGKQKPVESGADLKRKYDEESRVIEAWPEQISKELEEGPTKDRLSLTNRARLEKQFGPVLPQVPFKKYAPFIPERVDFYIKDALRAGEWDGIPYIRAVFVPPDYHGSVDEFLTVEIRDERLMKGSMLAFDVSSELERTGSRSLVIRGFKANYDDKSEILNWISVRAGRFSVRATGSDIKVIRRFIDAIDLEKLSVCADAEVPSVPSGKVTLCALTPEERAAVEKALAEGLKEDRLGPELRGQLENRFGPVMPQVPFRKMSPLLPVSVGEWNQTHVFTRNPIGCPSVGAYYYKLAAGERKEAAGWNIVRVVTVEITDDRQEKGGFSAYFRAFSEETGKKRDPEWKPSWKTGEVRGFAATMRDDNRHYQWVRVKAGRFEVRIQANDMEVIRRFADAIDLEKLSKTK